MVHTLSLKFPVLSCIIKTYFVDLISAFRMDRMIGKIFSVISDFLLPNVVQEYFVNSSTRRNQYVLPDPLFILVQDVSK